MGELQRCGEVLVLIDTKEGCVIRILFSYDEIAFAILKNAFTIAPIYQQDNLDGLGNVYTFALSN